MPPPVVIDRCVLNRGARGHSSIEKRRYVECMDGARGIDPGLLFFDMHRKNDKNK
jgi:hypothetical protein